MTERIQLRMDDESLTVINKAAAILRKPLATFIKEIVIDAARDIIDDQESLPLSDRDWNFFLNALTVDINPNKALLKANKLHDEFVR